MKSLIVTLTLALSFSACSTSNLKSEKEIQKYPYRTTEEIKQKVSDIVDAHDEFSPEQKTKIKKIVQKGVDVNNELKIKLSKLAQLMLDTLMSKKNPTRGEIGKIKSDMKKIYNLKEKNLVDTAKELKKVIGVSVENKQLSQEIFPYLNR